MLRTRVGYCGGLKEAPTYRSIGDHTEAISIDYDPAVLSFEKILEVFWEGHNWARNHPGTQYRNALFFRDDEQKLAAEVSRDKRASELGFDVKRVATHIVPMRTFTIAEGYHQKYYLTRFHDIREFLESHYPSAKELADSTVATRLNAYLGSGMQRDWSQFEKELPEYGLPSEMEEHLRNLIPGNR